MRFWSMNSNLFVISGGPGTGKTSVINELKSRGYKTAEESARKLCSTDERFKGKAIKDIDMVEFQNAVFEFQKDQFKALAGNESPVFLERGFGDTVAYAKIYVVDFPDGLIEFSKDFRYSKIFILDFLDFYKQDELRKESSEEQEKIHNEIIQAYSLLGYDVVFVPNGTINERTDFVLSKVQ